MTKPPSATDMDALLDVMRALRDPVDGCPWDAEQDFQSIMRYTIEEAYEVAGAIEHGDMNELRDELGDLLLQVVFHARMAEELGHFDFNDVCQAIVGKMIRRHPHVFGTPEQRGKGMNQGEWEKIKAGERAGKQLHATLDDVPVALPALMRAEKLQKRAARVGFDWPDIAPVFDKMSEEITELNAAMQQQSKEHIHQEMGDILFTCVNLARHLKVDPEAALRDSNAKFLQRFHRLEQIVNAEGGSVDETSLAQLDAIWNRVKRDEE